MEKSQCLAPGLVKNEMCSVMSSPSMPKHTMLDNTQTKSVTKNGLIHILSMRPMELCFDGAVHHRWAESVVLASREKKNLFFNGNSIL
jgi:hypothetical protein